jgi:hypothetical protein
VLITVGWDCSEFERYPSGSNEEHMTWLGMGGGEFERQGNTTISEG